MHLVCQFFIDFGSDCYPSAIKAVGYSDHRRRAGPLRLWDIVITRGGRMGPLRLWGIVRNSVLTKKVTDEFCLFFTDMTYVPGQFVPYIFFGTKP